MIRFQTRSMQEKDRDVIEPRLQERGMSLGGEADSDDPTVHVWVAVKMAETTRQLLPEDPPAVLGIISILRSNTIGILFVAEEHRGLGIGTQLLREAETWLHLRVAEARITGPSSLSPWFEKKGYHVQGPTVWGSKVTLVKNLPEPCGGPRNMWAASP